MMDLDQFVIDVFNAIKNRIASEIAVCRSKHKFRDIVSKKCKNKCNNRDDILNSNI